MHAVAGGGAFARRAARAFGQAQGRGLKPGMAGQNRGAGGAANEAAGEFDIGAQVRALRKTRGMTLQEVADRIGVSIGTMSQIERNRSRLTIGTLTRIAQLFGAHVTDVAGLRPYLRGVDRHAMAIPLQNALDDRFAEVLGAASEGGNARKFSGLTGRAAATAEK